MSSWNADLIAVSLACPKNPKSPFGMGPPKLVVFENSWRKLETWETLQFWSSQNLASLSFTEIYTKPCQTVSDYHPLFLFWVYIFALRTFKKIFWMHMRLVLYSQVSQSGNFTFLNFISSGLVQKPTSKMPPAS